MIKKVLKYLKFHLWQKPRIPKGDYCYTIKHISYSSHPRQATRIFIKKCPYWESIDPVQWGYEARCRFLEKSGVLIDDQCKECNINIGDEKYE